jgi:type VI secretion system secreted protein Hcp
MAVDMFLKINGIPGESVNDKHKGEIDVLSFGWGATQTATFGGATGGGSSGKAQIQDLSFVKQPDIATGKLFKAVVTGEHIEDATLTLVKSENQQPFMIVKMSDVLITGYQAGGSAGMLPAEQVSFAFAKIELSTAEQKPDGTMGPMQTVGFDITQNRSL